jgi:hypothetical protein
MNRFFLVVGCTLTLSATVASADDSQARFGLTLKMVERDKLDLGTYVQMDLHDSAPNPSLYMIAERLQVKPWEHLSFGLNYTFIEKDIRTKQGDEVFTQQQRAEFEINPHWQLNDHVTLNLRNRLEYRWLQGQPDNVRSRHRLEFVFPVKGAKPLAELFTSYEFFYDYDRNRQSEWRVAPLGFHFKFSERVALKTYYVAQNIHGTRRWDTSHLLFTQWAVSFR